MLVSLPNQRAIGLEPIDDWIRAALESPGLFRAQVAGAELGLT